MTTHLYLIRHGEAVSNVEPFIGGTRGDRGLTRRGVEQAARLRDRLGATGEIEADVLIASTLPRARQTAEIIQPALGRPIVWDDDVQELRPGEADGMSLDEYRARFAAPDRAEQPFRPMSPGGESWPAFMLRAGMALDRIAREHRDKTIVVVCHGGVIEASFVLFMGLNSVATPPIEFGTHNTSITHWSYRREQERRRWRLDRFNDDAHLRDFPIGPGDVSTERATGGDRTSVPLPDRGVP